MSQAPAMPVFTDALLGDTLHLSTEEFGAYCLLLFATWRNNGKPLLDDPKKLSRICRVTQRRWEERLRPAMIGFFDVTDGSFRQKRLEKEWKYVTDFASSQSRNAKARWLKNNETDNATAYADEMPNECPHTLPLRRSQEEEPRSETSETVAVHDEGSQNAGGLGRFAPSVAPAAAEPEPPTAEQVAEVDALVNRAVATLNGSVPKGVIEPAAHAEAIKRNKFGRFVKNLNQWVSDHLDGDERFAAWETIAIADAVRSRSAMPPAARQKLDELDRLYRLTQGGVEA